MALLSIAGLVALLSFLALFPHFGIAPHFVGTIVLLLQLGIPHLFIVLLPRKFAHVSIGIAQGTSAVIFFTMVVFFVLVVFVKTLLPAFSNNEWILWPWYLLAVTHAGMFTSARLAKRTEKTSPSETGLYTSMTVAYSIFSVLLLQTTQQALRGR